MILQKFTIILALVLFGGLASAAELSLQINGRSDHHGKPVDATGERVKLNEGNYGAGVQYTWKSTGIADYNFLTGGTLINSVEDRSWYAGGGKLWRLGSDKAHIDGGFIAGLIHYPSAVHSNFPAVLPMLSVGTDDIAINAIYIPKVTEEVVPAVLFQLRIRLSGQRSTTF